MNIKQLKEHIDQLDAVGFSGEEIFTLNRGEICFDKTEENSKFEKPSWLKEDKEGFYWFRV